MGEADREDKQECGRVPLQTQKKEVAQKYQERTV